MPLATVTVKFINQPKEGKKEGSIRVQDDSFYGVPPALLAQFQQGGTYEVDYTSREWQGKTFKSVKSVKAVGAAPATAHGGGGGGDKDTPMRIFICGAYNNAIQAGQLNVLNEDDCVKAVEDPEASVAADLERRGSSQGCEGGGVSGRSALLVRVDRNIDLCHTEVMKKKCFKCGKLKPLGGFHKHKMMADGHLNKCKECVIAYVHKHRKANLERIQAYDRERGQDPQRKKANNKRYHERISTAKGREKEWERARQDRARRKLERSVYTIVWHALERGELIRQPCVRCGHRKSEAHHEDYYKPLNITWLCKPCHGKRHRELNEQKRNSGGPTND